MPSTTGDTSASMRRVYGPSESAPIRFVVVLLPPDRDHASATVPGTTASTIT